MELRGRLTDATWDAVENKFELTFKVERPLVSIDEIENQDLSIKVNKWRKKRSLDANGLLWVLIGKIASKVNLEPIRVYRKFVKDAGVYEVIPIRNDALDRFIETWEKNGVGWVCETTKSKLDGYTNVLAYYGSSTYNSKEISVLLDSVIETCKELNIETLPEEELHSIKECWK